MKSVSFNLQGKEVVLETGRLAKQSDGSVLVKCGDSRVLVTVVSDKSASTMDFFPLTVEVQERFYSVGRIPGGFFKREGRPSGDTILNCRLIDRPLRPCFPDGYKNPTQIVSTVLSSDNQTSLTSLAIIGASAALSCSDIPFSGPVAAIQIARINKEWKLNPGTEDLHKADLSLFVAARKEGILMVEGEADFVSEAEVLEGLKFAYKEMGVIFKAQEDLESQVSNGKKRSFTKEENDKDFEKKVKEFVTPLIKEALACTDKMDRYAKYAEFKSQAKTELLKNITEDKASFEKQLSSVFDDVKYTIARNMILEDGKRIDGRNMVTVRPIDCTVGDLPRAHGSSVFTRGETQVLAAVTLGTQDDEQRLEKLEGAATKKFMLHYNFPPYCVGETGRLGGQSRREVGHGMLAERALQAIIPKGDSFPYTVRLVSEVLESNGSSSMGTVCSGSLALMDAGIPVHTPIAGIAMGLISNGTKNIVLTDILGDEDHLGDMDFKVAGSATGITALQMDIKIESLGFDVLEQALSQAKDGRLHILKEMEKALSEPRKEFSTYAPKQKSLRIPVKKVRDVIGSGGKVIRGIIDSTGAKVDIEDDGLVTVFAVDKSSLDKAMQMIEDIIAEVEVGRTYPGKVLKITDFGAFVEVLPNTSGLLHISELAHERVRKVEDVLSEGDTLDVKVLDVDHSGRIKLSRKALLNS